MKITKNELCPIHGSRFCCGRQRRAMTSLSGVRRIEDPLHPRGYREYRSSAAMRRLLRQKPREQNLRCTICGRKFRSFEDAVPDHIEPRGMGGAWRDDHPDNIQAPPLQPQSIPELAQTGAGWSGRAVAVCLSWKSPQRSRSQILPRSGNGDRVTRRPASEFLGSETMRPVAKLYREFCLRTAQMLEDEANRYANHPALQDEDQQFIQVLRQKCREWKQQIEKLDHAQMRAWDRTAG